MENQQVFSYLLACPLINQEPLSYGKRENLAEINISLLHAGTLMKDAS